MQDGDFDFSSANPDVRARILDLVERVCTKKQVAAVRLFLEGQSLNEIAKAMGISKSTVWNHLHGRPDDAKGGGGGGAIAKLRREFERDPKLKGFVTMKTTTTEDEQPGNNDRIATWFARLPPGRVTLFGPLAVLLVIDAVADSKRQMKRDDLRLYVPAQVASSALPILRDAGFIANDGITITIRRTPLDDAAGETTR